ncbi:hypothetical protein L1887_23675 [Cichorium endivia]|nr:hypothetical protein L1887_23675 [Cichorium endivia]
MGRARVVAGTKDESGWHEVCRKTRRAEDYSVNGKAITYFITDIPYDWKEADLWNLLRQYGTLVDVYIAKKRSKTNNRFGFARFIKIHNAAGFERTLNGVWCGNRKLKVNLARFERRSDMTRNNHPDQDWLNDNMWKKHRQDT